MPNCLQPGGLEWIKPKNNYIKINCDASWLAEVKEGGARTIARDEAGVILAVQAKHLPNVTSVVT
ncbi:hypothetical protein QQ045_012130 [Rhodiola kirilowii]